MSPELQKITKKIKLFSIKHGREILRYLEGFERTHVILGLFAAYAFFIIFTAFRYTVVDHDYYQWLADRQQTIEVKNSVSRWTIYSNNKPAWVFSTSTDLSDLAIDPQEIWSKDKLQAYLIDVVFEELCIRQTPETCYENLLSFVKKTELVDYIYSDAYIRGKISEELKVRINKQWIDSIILRENAPQDILDTTTALSLSGIYVTVNNIYADPTVIESATGYAQRLAPVLGLKEAELIKKLEKRPAKYVKILRRLSLNIKEKIDIRLKNENTQISKWLLKNEESIVNFFILEPVPSRFYPEKSLASQIIWFVDNLWEGRYGIEWYFNEELKGQQSIITSRKDNYGRVIGGYDLSKQKTINGYDITLTVDRNIQKEVERLLAEWVKEYRANKGSVVIMDPKTGAVIAMANYPTYDPNDFGNVYELEKVSRGRYPNPGFDLLGMPVFVEDSENGENFVYENKKIKLRDATDSERENGVIPKYKFKNNFWPNVYVNDSLGGLYEPGSVFKAVTTAIAIDTGDIKPTDRYHDKGKVEIDNFTISNVANECTGYHTYSHALDWSCNVGMIDIVQKIWKSLFAKYISDFGFGQKTNITLEGEVFGKIEPYEKWSRAKLFTMSFGQGITANLLQMAAAYSVIANGGVYMQPYIVDSVILPSGNVITNAPQPLRRVIKEETSKKLIAMLTEGATIGFAKKGAVEGYNVAGKTGTSQIASKGKYEVGTAGHTITSYGWFAPSSNPKFVMIVRIDRPRSAVYAETTSSALFSRIAKYVLNYYGIPKSK